MAMTHQICHDALKSLGNLRGLLSQRALNNCGALLLAVTEYSCWCVTLRDCMSCVLFFSSQHQTVSESNLLAIHNLPIKRAVSSVRVRLEQLSENCGGKVVHLSNGTAVIKFPNQESAFR